MTDPDSQPEATVIDGFRAYAPELARAGDGYDAELFAQLAELEPGSFWFRSRNALLAWALRTHHPAARSFLEIGCGTGFVLRGLADRHPQLELTGSELFVDGLSVARERVPQAELIQLDAREIPFVEAYDVIGAFDVIEHIEADERVLDQMHRALRPGGLLMVSVPQHRWLWSSADEHAHHVRRYTRRELTAKVRAAGFEPVLNTSFVTLLLPLLVVSRLADRVRTRSYDPADEMRLPRWLDRGLERVMDLERWSIRRGVRWPVGGSRLLVARRPG